MQLYPDVPARRTATIVRDAATVLAIIVFAWIGVKVHDAVDELAVLGTGVGQAGDAVRSGFGSAADAVDDTPIVGDDLSDGLRDAGSGSGGRVQTAGRKGEQKVHALAKLLGWLTFLVPTALLLAFVLPPRIRQVRRMASASRVLGEEPTPERRRLIAMRAAFALPYGQLLHHTRDPLGDLEDERYDALVAAAFEDAGLRVATTLTAAES